MDIKVCLLVLIVLIKFGESHDHGRDNRVVGGFESRPHQFPFLVALVLTADKGSQSFCGGSIIGPNHILTAAHCIEKIQKIDVMAGVHNVFMDKPLYHAEVFERDFLIHYAYNSDTLENDIALIYLQTPIPLSSKLFVKVKKNKLDLLKKLISDLMNPVTLPTRNQAMNQFTGTVITIAGWGRYSDCKYKQINQIKNIVTCYV